MICYIVPWFSSEKQLTVPPCKWLSLLRSSLVMWWLRDVLTELKSHYKSSNVCLSVCLFVCSPTPPRSFDGSSPNLVGVCRWTSELPLRGQRVNGSTGQRVKCRFFGADDTRLRPHRCKRHGVFWLPSKRRTTSKSLIPLTGIITSVTNSKMNVTAGS